MIVAHNGDCNMMVALSNMADSVVTMEFLNGQSLALDLRTIHPYIRAFPASPVLMIPNYRWYWQASATSREMMEDAIAKGALLGSCPFHLDIYYHPEGWGYADALAGTRDPRGIWGAFRRLKDMDLRSMKFDDCYSGAVKVDRKAVLGARYRGKGRQIVVIANLSGRKQRNLRWKCDGAAGEIAQLAQREFTFVPVPT
jgi:hypothetical protein